MPAIPISVVNGMIEVETASGVVGEDHFILYLSLREKYAVAEVVASNPAIIAIRATKDTRRYAADHDTRITIDLNGPSTLVTLPIGWTVEASVSRYTCVVVGVRTPATERLESLPINFVTTDGEAVQAACRTA